MYDDFRGECQKLTLTLLGAVQPAGGGVILVFNSIHSLGLRL